MFFSSEMLSKRGPLAKVWLAAHVERKVSKAQTLQTSIPSTVTVILEPASTNASAPPLALRLSGQLLLGIARIYSKQAKYLLEDCSEASDKIRAAFRSDVLQSMIDNPTGEDHLFLQVPTSAQGRDAINLRNTANRNVFDFELEFGDGFGYGFGDGWEELNQANETNDILPIVSTSRSRIDANVLDITLHEQDSFIPGLDRPGQGLDTFAQDDFGLAGDDGDGMNLGLPGVEAEGLESEIASPRKDHQTREASIAGEDGQVADETMEIEVGRDAPGTSDRRSARDSLLPGPIDDFSFDKSYDMNSGVVDVSFRMEDGRPAFESTRLGTDPPYENAPGDGLGLEGNTDLGPNQGAPEVEMRDAQESAVHDGQATPRANTPVPDALLDPFDVTPRTSHRLAPHLTSPAVEAGGADQQPLKKKKKHLVDRITELESTGGLSSSLGAGIPQSDPVPPPRFLPKDRYELRHYRLMLDPSRHEFLPKLLDVDGERWLMAAPAGLCKELQELFKFPAKAGSLLPAQRGTKRPRVDEPEPEELESEHGRRALSVGYDGGDLSRLEAGDETLDLIGSRADDSIVPFGYEEGFQLEPREKSPYGPHSPVTHDLAPAMEDHGAEVEPTSIPGVSYQRGERNGSKLDIFEDLGDGHSQSQSTDINEAAGGSTRTKWSKNTVKALSVLKTELADETQMIKFKEVSEKASRRATAAFFFELLVLGTRDCLKLKQNKPFGEIEVRGQGRLWQVLEQQAI